MVNAASRSLLFRFHGVQTFRLNSCGTLDWPFHCLPDCRFLEGAFCKLKPSYPTRPYTVIFCPVLLIVLLWVQGGRSGSSAAKSSAATPETGPPPYHEVRRLESIKPKLQRLRRKVLQCGMRLAMFCPSCHAGHQTESHKPAIWDGMLS